MGQSAEILTFKTQRTHLKKIDIYTFFFKRFCVLNNMLSTVNGLTPSVFWLKPNPLRCPQTSTREYPSVNLAIIILDFIFKVNSNANTQVRGQKHIRRVNEKTLIAITPDVIPNRYTFRTEKRTISRSLHSRVVIRWYSITRRRFSLICTAHLNVSHIGLLVVTCRRSR